VHTYTADGKDSEIGIQIPWVIIASCVLFFFGKQTYGFSFICQATRDEKVFNFI
jgi:hypothetical protein